MSIDPNIVSGIIGFSGALVGGYISYKGTLKGIEKNIEENKKIDEKMLITQLKHSINIIEIWKEYFDGKKDNSRVPYNISSIIYDNEWYKHLLSIDRLSFEEKESIIVLFTWFSQIEYIAGFSGGYLTKKQLEEVISDKYIDRSGIDSIMKKLNIDC